MGSRSLIVRAPFRGPLAVGLKVTLIVQVAPPARAVPQLLVWAKSGAFAPVIEIPLIVSDVLVLKFLILTVFEVLVVPTF